MKKNIHPNYVDCEITCLCGNVIHTRSTKDKLNVEICSACHPFFTGQQKIVDTAGRVERFRKRYEGVSTTRSRSAADSAVERRQARIRQDLRGCREWGFRYPCFCTRFRFRQENLDE